MTFIKKITIILLLISVHFVHLNAQDLIENTRAGIHPGLIKQNNSTITSIFDNIDKHWDAKEAIVMDVFNTTQLQAGIADDYNNYLSDYVSLDLISSELDYIYKQQPTHVLMIIPVTENKHIELTLMKSDDIAVGNYSSACLHYKGVVNGASGSMAALTFTNNQISVMINDIKGNYLLNKTIETKQSYILYNDQKLDLRESVSCSAIEDPFGGGAKMPDFNMINSTERSYVDRCISVYFECDYNTFLTYNSSVDEVEFKIESTFNQVQQIYAEEDITIQIADIEVFTEPDPEMNEFNAANLLDQKASRLEDNFPGNLVHFVTTKIIGVGGRGYIGGKHSLSSLNSRNEQSPFPDYSRDVYLVAHEIGHNLGSHHTHACVWGASRNEALDNCYEPEGFCVPGPTPTNGGTIMSYCMLNTNIGVNFTNGFGVQPGAVIRQGAQNYTCQKSGCTNDEACNYNPFAEADDGSCVTGFDAGLFNDYPWILNELNEEDCSNSGVILYEINGQEYIYIFKPDGNTLYPFNRSWECRDGNGYNCRELYNLSNDNLVSNSCACGAPPTCNTDPCLEGGVQEWNSNSQSCEIVEPTYSGCNDPDACNYDPSVNCPDNSLCFYEGPDCAECLDSSIFDTYPWLSTEVDRSICDFDQITVITNGYYSYVYIVFSDRGVLYTEDGTFWAMDNGDDFYINWYIENAGYYKNACYTCSTGSCTYSNTGTFYFDDCDGANYYFIRLSDNRIFDPYLTEEDSIRLFGYGGVQEIEVKFDYVLNDIGNPCNIQTIDITCIDPVNVPDCDNHTGTFFFEDCGGANYYFIRLSDNRIFDPYLTEEDSIRLFGYGGVQEIEVRFDYVLSSIDNPCDVQAIDITCIEEIEQNTCNDGIKNGDELEIDCGGPICEPCESKPEIFLDYPELSDLVDPDNCNGETVMVFDYTDYVYIYVGTNNIGALYYAGNTFCEDAPDYSCLSTYHLNESNATAVWTCGTITHKQLNNTPPYVNQKIDQPSFNIYPNPSKGQIFIKLNGLDMADSVIHIYDVNGSKVITSSLGKTTNEKKIELSLNNLTKGIYFVEIEGKEFKQMQKLLIN